MSAHARGCVYHTCLCMPVRACLYTRVCACVHGCAFLGFVSEEETFLGDGKRKKEPWLGGLGLAFQGDSRPVPPPEGAGSQRAVSKLFANWAGPCHERGAPGLCRGGCPWAWALCSTPLRSDAGPGRLAWCPLTRPGKPRALPSARPSRHAVLGPVTPAPAAGTARRRVPELLTAPLSAQSPGMARSSRLQGPAAPRNDESSSPCDQPARNTPHRQFSCEETAVLANSVKKGAIARPAWLRG